MTKVFAMPHTTHAYPFELKVAGLAGRLFDMCIADESLRSLLLILDESGNVQSIDFLADADARLDKQHRQLQTTGTPYIIYAPLEDGMEYISLSWHKIEQATMERLTGEPFVPSDFTKYADRRGARELEPPNTFPTSWGVMF
jgi:hypothetical protein